MPFDPKSEIAPRVPNLLTLIREVVDAARKDSPGGVKITAEEWLGIGQELGILATGVLADAVD